ncbi:uncharacterized [Tachysurus ichikawai]
MVAFLPTSVAVEFSDRGWVGVRERVSEKLDRSKWNAKVTSKFAAVGSRGSARQHALWRAGPLRTHRHLHLEEKLSDELDLQKEYERNKGGEPTDLVCGKKNSHSDIAESVCVSRDRMFPLE